MVKMKTVRLALSALIVAGAVYLSPPIFAQGNSNTLPGTQPGSQAIERIQERLEENQDTEPGDRCRRLTARIQNRIRNFETNRERHRERYLFLAGKLAESVTRLRAKGYDTSALEAHLQEYNGLVGNYTRQYAEFIDSLETTGNFACGESEGAYEGALRESHAMLQTALQTRAEIRHYYRTVIREDIKILRSERP